MKLNSIKIKDFLIISEVDIELDPKYNIFIGKNHEGKTAILKAIETTLKGTTDPSVIKTGAEESRLTAETDSGLSIERVIGKKGQRVRSKAKDKSVDTTQQGYVTGLLGDFSFNPIKFVQQDNKGARKKYITELYNPKVTADMLPFVEPELLSRVDFGKDGLSILKELENIYYERRTGINKQVNQKEAAYKEMLPKDYNPANDQEYDTEALQNELIGLTERINEADRAKRQKEANERIRVSIRKKVVEFQGILDRIDPDAINKIDERVKYIGELEVRIKKLQEALVEESTHYRDALLLKSVREDTLKAIAEQEKSLDEFPIPEIPDIQEIEKRRVSLGEELQKADVVAKAREKYEKAQAVNKEYEAINTESERLSTILDTLRKKLPAKILKDANIPIEGLSFEGDKVFINGINMDNMSTQEQVTAAVNIVREINANAIIKALCIDGAETLDWESLEAFRLEIKDDEFQYCLSYVQHSPDDIPEGAIFVRSGKVFYNRPEKKEDGEVKKS